MNWQWNPLAIPPIFSALLAIYLIFNTRSFLNLKGAKRIIALLGLVAWWNLGYSLELLTTLPSWMVTLRVFQFIAICFLPGLFLTYIIAFTGFGEPAKPPFLVGLFTLPTAILILALTNNRHHLVWASFDLIHHRGSLYLTSQPLYGMWAFWIYAALATLGTITLLTFAIFRAPRLYGRHNSVMVFATLYPLIQGILDLQDVFNLPYYHLNSVSTAFSVVIMRISLTRFFRNDLTAASRTIIFDSLDNAIFVINRLGDIIDVNTYASQLLDIGKQALVGMPLLDFMPELGSTKFFRQVPGIDHLQWLVRDDKTYQVIFTPIKDGQGQVLGSVVSLNDLSSVVQQASDLKTILQTAQQVSSTLDLHEVLVRFAGIAQEISGYHNCIISEWDHDQDTTSTLVELNRAVYSRKESERYSLKDLPTSCQVLTTSESARISIDDPDPETRWMAEVCVSHLLMMPLYSDRKIVGMLEICRVNPLQPFTADEEAEVLPRLKAAARWIQDVRLSEQAVELHALALEIGQRIEADLVAISEWDQEADELITITEYSSLSWEFKQGPERQVKLVPSFARALRQGEITNTFRGDPKLHQEDQVNLQRWGAMSMVVLPLTYQGERIGLLELYHMSEAKRIDQNTLRLLEGIAEYASISIQNARIYRETERNLREQVILKEASLVISSSLELDTVLEKLTEQLALVVDATSAYLLTYDRLKRITTVVSEYYSPAADPLELVSDLGIPYDEKEEWFHRFDQGMQYRISHIDDPDLPKHEKSHMQTYGAKTVLYLPIRFMGSVLGHAEIWESRRNRQFTPEEISLCQTISQQAGSAIEHAIRFEQSQHQATHDALTGLANRAMLTQRLERAIHRAKRRPEQKFALIYLDLDGFKIVNDSLGHIAGDEFLAEIGQRLVKATRKVDTVSRFGGDEFAILMEDIPDIHSVIRLVERIRDEISRPVLLRKNEIVVTSSIGIVLSSEEYSSTMEYLRDADIAMYRAKQYGKARYEVFDQRMRVEVNARLKLEQELRAAYDAGQFLFHYQPVYRFEDRFVIGLEAYLRWEHPRRGLLLPASFLQVAEETGVLFTVTNSLLSGALHQVNAWQQRIPSYAPLSLAINISGRQLTQPGYFGQIEDILQKTGTPGEMIHLEITERSILEDFNSAALILAQLKALGIKITLDDFGTGYSSLNYLRQLPVDLVKIDRSLIDQLDQELYRNLCRTILHMANDLGLEVVAEGVETEVQRQILIDMGCKFGQGYLFSEPQPAAAIEPLLHHSLLSEISRSTD